MTKKELCEIANISRPTLDSRLESKEANVFLFLLSFEKWEVENRIEFYKNSINGMDRL